MTGEYMIFAQAMFSKIKKNIPANHCTLLEDSVRTSIDAGVDAPGGWSAVQSLLDGFLGGCGEASLSRREFDGNQVPVIEMFFDDPVLALKTAFKNQNGVYGVKSGAKYALGLVLGETEKEIKAEGNIVVAGASSLLACAFDAAAILPEAVDHMLGAGVKEKDILWGWSSCPMASMAYDAALMKQRKKDMRIRGGIASIWARGRDDDFYDIVRACDGFSLRIHNLVSANTILYNET